MNSREHLAEDLDRLITRTRQIGWVAWSVAIFVMVYGTPIVYGLATDHGIPAEVAWMLSLAADGALIVGLIATPVLASLQIPAGWVGTLRWVSGATTWTLQTLSSWIAPGGPDMVGVGVHTAGPLLLFVVVEAASYFQRKVASAITTKTRELQAAEQKDADRRAHLAELEADLRTTRANLAVVTSERDNHLREIDRLTAEVTSTTAAGTSEADDLRDTIKALEVEREDLRTAFDRRLEAASTEHAEALRRLKQVHAAKLAEVRAEASTINLAAHRNRTSATGGGGTSKTPPKPRISDEDAVQRLLNTPADKDQGLPSGDLREWTQSDIVTVLGVGWGRAPRLLEAVTEAQQQRSTGGTSEATG